MKKEDDSLFCRSVKTGMCVWEGEGGEKQGKSLYCMQVRRWAKTGVGSGYVERR